MSAGRLLLAKWPARYPDHLSFITPPRLASWTVGRFAIERSMNLPFGGGFWRNMYHYALLRKV
jgi:hypothetical protein